MFKKILKFTFGEKVDNDLTNFGEKAVDFKDDLNGLGNDSKKAMAEQHRLDEVEENRKREIAEKERLEKEAEEKAAKEAVLQAAREKWEREGPAWEAARRKEEAARQVEEPSRNEDAARRGEEIEKRMNEIARRNEEEAAKKEEELKKKFGEVKSIVFRKVTITQGMTKKELIRRLGPPQKTKEEVLKTKTKENLEYAWYRSVKESRITIKIENGIVVGWTK